MTFPRDTVASLLAAIELVNTAEGIGSASEGALLERFFFKNEGYVPDAGQLAALRDLRAPLRRLLMGDKDVAARMVNSILSDHRAVPQLIRHDEVAYRLVAVLPDASLDQRLAVEAAMAMVEFIRTDELARLLVCADDTCDGIVLDLSRNRSRRFCSVACGNRSAVAASRARKKSS
ncbi:CGNR zinc finger domain-containing protein [Nocardia sp. NPDC055321]